MGVLILCFIIISVIHARPVCRWCLVSAADCSVIPTMPFGAYGPIDRLFTLCFEYKVLLVADCSVMAVAVTVILVLGVNSHGKDICQHAHCGSFCDALGLIAIMVAMASSSGGGFTPSLCLLVEQHCLLMELTFIQQGLLGEGEVLLMHKSV